MTSIPAIISNSLDHSTGQSTLDTAVQTLSTHAPTLKKITKYSAITISGLALTIGSAILKALTPDKELVDKLWFITLLIGAATTIGGFIGLSKQNSVIKNQTIPPTELDIDKNAAEQISGFVKEVSTNPNGTFKISNDIVNAVRLTVSGTVPNPLRVNSYNLVKAWNEPANRFITVIRDNRGKSEFLFKGGNGTGQDITSSELKDRMAILIGYIVGSRPDAALDAESVNIVDDELKLSCIEKGDRKLECLLPNEFTLLYAAARHYKINHMDRDDSINQNSITIKEIYTNSPSGVTTPVSKTIGLNSIQNGLSSPGTPENDTAKEDIGTIATSRNYLRILYNGITFVRQIERNKKSGQKITESEQRDADILRSALVAGLGLKVNSLDDTIQQLERIQEGHTGNAPSSATGSPTGLRAKVDEMEKYWFSVKTAGAVVKPLTLKVKTFNNALEVAA